MNGAGFPKRERVARALGWRSTSLRDVISGVLRRSRHAPDTRTRTQFTTPHVFIQARAHARTQIHRFRRGPRVAGAGAARDPCSSPPSRCPEGALGPCARDNAERPCAILHAPTSPSLASLQSPRKGASRPAASKTGADQESGAAERKKPRMAEVSCGQGGLENSLVLSSLLIASLPRNCLWA